MDTKTWLLIIAVALISLPTPVESKPAARSGARPPAAHQAPGSKNNTAAYTAYLARLRGKLLNNWNVPNGKNKVTLTTVVSADGSVGDISLSSIPKNAEGEIAGSEAFAKSQPLEAVPGGGQVKLILTFESNADPHGDSNSNVYTQIVPIAQPRAASTPGSAATGGDASSAPADASAPAK